MIFLVVSRIVKLRRRNNENFSETFPNYKKKNFWKQNLKLIKKSFGSFEIVKQYHEKNQKKYFSIFKFSKTAKKVK